MAFFWRPSQRLPKQSKSPPNRKRDRLNSDNSHTIDLELSFGVRVCRNPPEGTSRTHRVILLSLGLCCRSIKQLVQHRVQTESAPRGGCPSCFPPGFCQRAMNGSAVNSCAVLRQCYGPSGDSAPLSWPLDAIGTGNIEPCGVFDPPEGSNREQDKEKKVFSRALDSSNSEHIRPK
jgi:hypothetical protein